LTVSLRAKALPPVGLEADCLTPDNLLDRNAEEISRIRVWCGRRRMRLGRFFDIETDASGEFDVEISGDLSRVKRIAQEMSTGSLHLLGHAGMHLGNSMKGGKVIVEGNVSSWCGAEMAGGSIEIGGDAGHYLGGSYRGSPKGMTGGSIHLRGSAGHELGCRMAGGEIEIAGGCGDFASVHQSGGLVRVAKGCGYRPAASMSGGALVVDGPAGSLIPGARYAGVKSDPEIESRPLKGIYAEFLCDQAERTQGRLFLLVERNRSLLAPLGPLD